MSDVPPPPPTYTPPPSEPGGPPPGGPGYPSDAGAPPPKKGLSTGAKIGIGCGALLLLALILMFTCFRIVGKKASDLADSAEDQAEASEKAEELEREYAFQPPADRTLDEGMVDKFFAVTEDTWDEIGDWVQDMEKRGERIEKSGDEAGFGDAMAAMQGMGRARTALIKALDDNDMAPSAYVWTGMTLMQAHEAAAAGEGASPGTV